MRRTILLVVLLATACAQTPTGDVTIGDEMTDKVLDEPQLECDRVGGDWKQFPDTCADTCSYQRGETDYCAMVLTDNCYCGPQRCWNGQTCEAL